MAENILDEDQLASAKPRRRDLLPTWIKVFTWIFLILGASMPLVLMLGLIGMSFDISLYGLSTMQPLSMLGIALTLLFVLKGIVALGLWTEREWAVNLARFDAGLGIVICLLVMLVLPFFEANGGFVLTFRAELIVLFFYLSAMNKIKAAWMEGAALKKE